MTIQEALTRATAQFKKTGVHGHALDAEVLMVHSLTFGFSRRSHNSAMVVLRNQLKDRSWILAHPEYQLTRAQVQRFKNLVARRVRREPVAYILGHKEFYGLDFLVDRRVMVPRPETEMLVNHAIEDITSCQLPVTSYTIVDVGTGSGAIAVAMAIECKIQNVKCKIIATDISLAALRVAKQNARRHGVAGRITFLRGNLLKPWLSKSHGREILTTLPRHYHLVITANLPYLPTSEWRASAPEIKKWEPRSALEGGKDGLRYYWELFRQLKGLVSLALSQPVSSNGVVLRSIDETPARHRYGQQNRHRRPIPVTLLCEICPHQQGAFKKLVRRYFPRARVEARQHIALVRI